MDSKRLKRKTLFVIFIAIFFICLFKLSAEAAGAASIYPLPNNGNYNLNDTFTVDLVVDGDGTQFNAAKGQLTLSNNLIIQDLTLGDCGFAFVNTPSTKKPAFTGVILGSSSDKCIVYRLTLKAIGEGTGSLSVTDGSVKSYEKAQEILGSLGAATFTIGSASSQTVHQQNIQTNQFAQPMTAVQNQAEPSSYTVVFTIKDADGNPLKDAVVVLNPQTANKVGLPSQTVISKSDGTAEFTNIPKAVYRIDTVYKNKKLAENVLAINGTAKTITLGIQVKKTFNYFWLLLIIPLAIIILAIYLLIKRKSEIPQQQ